MDEFACSSCGEVGSESCRTCGCGGACDGMGLPRGACDTCGAPCGGSAVPSEPTYYYMIASFLMVSPAMLRPRPRRARAAFLAWPAAFGAWLIGLYQRFISHRLNVTCRYEPSCSHYGKAAVQRYGLVTGSRLALLRIMRCQRDVPHGTKDELK